ncbi:MAG: protein-export membrane protein SecF, preprotein translocase subunit SecF [Candidatus Gottesmanbacteria bacterium GW2011_GWA2_43_14]|uniref:Protein-export membrane protein SecF n=1 Tax=Candidatus Gottesmanbacteria bacterium GW2011_GWA2_43_14 TaxID=1618443 RepID=A0A0G1DET1_9BACT|nr:MAG: protein-export membrane protein SecF, preprotein translocase subunit SecF [Candidatus Gottesmanbacteria bacterium GW2011_GWA2_43_14]
MNIIKYKNWFFAFSGAIILPGIVSLLVWGIKPSIDFTGGSLLEIKAVDEDKNLDTNRLASIAKDQGIQLVSASRTQDGTYLLRLKPLDKDQNRNFQNKISQELSPVEEVRFETVGPTIGAETTRNAFYAVVVSTIAIIIYIALSFRAIPKPYSSWKFGVSAVLTLIHDVVLVVGVFSLLGRFFNVEVDSLFITALLTIMGFSIHDSIVVYDRIRENLRKMPGEDFAYIVNESIVQTLARSLSTSLTVLFTLFALLLFSGESIRWFVFALLIGIASGSYSSILAAPILIAWEKRKN